MKKFLGLILSLILVISIFPTQNYVKAAKESYVTDEEIKNAVSNYTLSLEIDGAEQQFWVESSEISKLSGTSQKLSKDGKKLTVKTYVFIDRKVATVKTQATITFKLVKDNWKEKKVTFKKTSIYKIPVKGTWKGTYVANQGETACTLKIDKVSKDGYMSGKFIFGSTPTNKVPDGSYSITGGYDKKTGKVRISGNEWIEQPSGWYMIDFNCYVDLVNESIKGNNNELDITKTK